MVDNEVYQRLENMAIAYQKASTVELRQSRDNEVKEFLWKEYPTKFQKFWIYYQIRKED